jgi:hypothetical protein
MNNEIEFVTPAHNLLLRNASPSDDAQERLHQRLLCVIVALAPIDWKRGLGCFQDSRQVQITNSRRHKDGSRERTKKENKTPVWCRSNRMDVCIERS